MRPLFSTWGRHFPASAAGSAVLIVLFFGHARAWTEQDKARADQHCASARQAAQAADRHGRRAIELGLKVEEETRQLSQAQALIASLENEKNLKENELRSLQAQLRDTAGQLQALVQRGRSEYRASLAGIQGQSSRNGAARATAYVETMMNSLGSFANALARCVDLPAVCASPMLSCPAPPQVPGAAAILGAYQQACASANRGAAETLRKLQDDAKAIAAVKEKLQAARLEKQRLELTLAEDRRRAAEEKTAAEQETERAQSEALAADQAVGISKFCEVHMKDYSAEVEKLRAQVEEATRKTEQLMRGAE